MERKKISGKLAQRRKDKEEFIKISKQAILLTSVLLAFIFGVRYQLKQPRIIYVAETATSTATTTSKQAKIAPKSVVKSKPVDNTVSQEKLEVVRAIAKTFPDNAQKMVAISIEESGLNKNIVGYNCRYKIGGATHDSLTGYNIDLSNISKESKKGYVSTFCRAGHEKFAWSKDGGALMIHQPTAYEMTLKGNMETARNKYDKAGLNSWVAYSTGRYAKHLKEADKLLAMI